MLTKCLVALSLLVVAACSSASIVTKTIDYDFNGMPLRGYLAYDNAKTGWRTGIVVFHDWDGVNDYEKMRCRMLAEKGYVAFAPDVFGRDAKLDTIPERQAMTEKLYADPINFRKIAEKGLEQLFRANVKVASNHVFAIGYCFGGASALELARDGTNLRGIVTFHGSLATKKPMVKNSFKGKVLVLTGGADPFVPKEQVDGLVQEMKGVGVDVRVVTYPGVGHAFTVKGSENMGLKGVAYDAHADQESWKALMAFLKELDK